MGVTSEETGGSILGVSCQVSLFKNPETEISCWNLNLSSTSCHRHLNQVSLEPHFSQSIYSPCSNGVIRMGVAME